MRSFGFLCFALTLGQLCACSDAQLLYDKYRGKKGDIDEEDYVPVPGEAATNFLSKALSNSAIGSASQLKALDMAIDDKAKTNLIEQGLLLEGSETSYTADSDVFDQVAGAEKNKRALDPTAYQKLEESYFSKSKSLNLGNKDYSGDTVTWGSNADTSFTIAALDRMPVRNQGRRGTCATFAGIGLIEALIIQQSSSSLPFKEIDLSEQRFYYLSKPDSWASGGDPNQQGSDSGTGFNSSSGQLSGYAGPSDTGGVSYNIPLESDCVYNPKLGTTDLQTPLPDGCKSKGVVRVSKFTSWAGSVGTANTIESAQQIYDELRRNKAVIVYTKLSSNWEKNDGIVTYKDSGGVGATSHASGHAYLIVGARKIDETAFPGEGGICFIIRNSWGTGWGAKGLSCMTLKWFNLWRFSGPLPTVDEVQLIDGAKNKITLASQRPSALPEPDPTTKKNNKGGSATRRRGKVVVSLAPDRASQTMATPWMPNAFGARALAEIDVASLTAADMSYGKLIADNDQTYKMLYATGVDTLVLRGVLSGDSSQTHSLELKRSGNLLLSDFSGRGDTIVGEFSQITSDDGATATAVVCGQKYASVCDLHYQSDSNELIIGLSQIEAKRQVSAPPYTWQNMQIAGYGFQMSRPASALTKFDVRMVKNGVESNPQRMKLDPSSGDISHRGQAVGNLSQGTLCSGSFKSTCRVVNTGDKFEIFSKSN